jgi:ABC-type cobalamin/Fe3+-siderophores transport system ATPase subunit
MTPQPRAIDARGVRVRLGGRWVVDGVDFRAAAGQISAIVGPNGSGKTTLLRALAGLIEFSGDIEHAEEDVRKLKPTERAQRVAYLPQTSSLNAMLSVEQVVALGRYASRPSLFSPSRQDDAWVAQALSRANITALAQKAYPQLSGGQQRLVLLARALATGATTLLLDEPTASLDVKHSLSLFELLGSLAREGYCIVLVLHDLDDVQRYAEHALLLDAGRSQSSGPPDAAAFQQAAENTYGVALVAHDRLGFRLRVDSAKTMETGS